MFWQSLIRMKNFSGVKNKGVIGNDGLINGEDTKSGFFE
jgi:hypothetical protein